jgi:hypothetical protein
MMKGKQHYEKRQIRELSIISMLLFQFSRSFQMNCNEAKF